MKYCQRCEKALSEVGNPYWNHHCQPLPNEEEEKEILNMIKRLAKEEIVRGDD